MSKHTLRITFNTVDPFDAILWGRIEQETNRQGYIKLALFDIVRGVNAAPVAANATTSASPDGEAESRTMGMSDNDPLSKLTRY